MNERLVACACALLIATGPMASAAAQTIWQGPFATGDWNGERTKFSDQGISLGGSWVMEGFDDVSGGAGRGVVGASTIDANLTLDLQKLAGVSEAEFYIDLEDHAGRNPDQLAGVLQPIDKLDWTAYLQIFEAYYQQKLFADQLRIKIGKIDANSEFSVIDNGLDFIDSSTQVTPTLLGFSTTPSPMPAIDLFYTPNKWFFADFSAALANRDDHFLDFTGRPYANEPTPNGDLLIGETGLTWDRLPVLGGDGNLKFGFWGHTGSFTRFDGRTQRGAQGAYAILDQTLWRPAGDDDRGVGVFLEYGQTDPAVSAIGRHYGAGITWTGPFAARGKDVFGITAQNADTSDQAGLPYRAEVLSEGFYKFQINQWLSLQPDLQYILHPGGRYPNAEIGMLDLQVRL